MSKQRLQKRAKSAIRDMVLDLRETLEGEIERELRRYGIYAERKWTSTDELNHLTEEERDEHRPRIETAIARERDAGLDQAEAVEAHVREAAYTHMNRLLGLKCMETRGLIEETITTRPIYSDRSKRHRDYLDDHPDARRAPDRGLIPTLGEAYADVSQHIGVVFDPDSDYTVVWPRHQVLKNCIDEINDLDDKVARKLDQDPDAVPSVYADDTFLGWVYQYFQEKEKDRVFRELRTEKKKIGGYDIVPATTIYTEHYMVQFLVENSLGALWMEMHPESDLCERWDYFVEDPNLQNEDGTRQRGREPRPVAGLTLLDPACGSGHFLLYAFDLFAQMFEAEARMGGRPVDRPAIARRILRENLHGIDIDLRSIQLSALNLYMKACTYAGLRLHQLQNGEPVQMNLVCADIVLGEGPELEELLARFGNDPLTQELIKTIWQGLQNARELGSLLKVEDQIDEVIARKHEAEKGTFWERRDDLWEQWKRDFVETLKSYVDRAAEAFDVNRQMLGREAIRGVQLLDLLTQRYEVVTTNPPYMHSRNMAATVRSFVKEAYEKSCSDLYACFISRGTELTAGGGFLAMISQQSFMFIRSYEGLRESLLNLASIRTMAHLGPGAFEDIGGEVVNTTMYTLRLSNPDNWKGTFIRVFEESPKASTLGELCGLRDGRPTQVFKVQQSRFLVIDGSPIAYWIPSKIFDLFGELSQLEEFASPVTGIQTGKNARFVRYWWEPREESLGPRWKTYAKGGPYNKYYGNLYWVVDWGKDGTRIREYEGTSIIRNEEYYFRRGVTYSDLASTGFNARLLPEGSLFDASGHSVFSSQYSPEYILGLLNAKLANYVLNILNPTFHFQVGDVARVPFAVPSEETEREIELLVEDCIESKRRLQSLSPEERGFECSGLEFAQNHLQALGSSVVESYLFLKDWGETQKTTLILHSEEIDSLIFELYQLGSAAKATVLDDQGLPTSEYPVLESGGIDFDLHSRFDAHRYGVSNIGLEEWATGHHARYPTAPDVPADELLQVEMRRLYVQRGSTVKEISAALQLNPISVIALRREMGLINPDDLQHQVENFLTHRIWELCKQDEDGIIPYAPGLRNPPLLDQVRREIEAVFGTGNAVSIEAEMDEILGRGGLAHWLENPFFKRHKSQFKRRPILWHITSPEKHFRVLVYYHKLDSDTLPKVRSQYLWPQLERARARLRAAKAQDPPDVKTIGELEEIIADLEECNESLERVIQGDVEVDLPDWAVGPYRNGTAPYDPDLDDGVKVNILPLQAAELLPYKRVV